MLRTMGGAFGLLLFVFLMGCTPSPRSVADKDAACVKETRALNAELKARGLPTYTFYACKDGGVAGYHSAD